MSLDKKTLSEAIKEARSKSEKKKFIQTIDLVINLQDIDLKKPEGKIQELIELPYALGKGKRLCVIASGEMALKARKAGADLVLERSEVEALSGDKKKQKQIVASYDLFIAEAPLMPVVGRVLGSTLGPKGKMPTPLPPNANVADQIEKQRKVIFVRLRGQPVLQSPVGTEDMTDDQIAENIQAVLRRIEGKLKRGIKNIRSIYLKTTMGQPVRIKL